MHETDLTMFKIGDFSRLCRVPVSKLRYYADIGLLEPEHIDGDTGYRFYTLEQLPRLTRILALSDLGFSLKQIADLLDDSLTIDQMRGMLKLRRAEIEQQVQDELARLERAEAWLKQLDDEDRILKEMEQQVEVRRIDTQHVLSIRETIPTLHAIMGLYGDACEALNEAGIEPLSPPLCIYYDDEWTGVDIDLELAFEVSRSVSDPLHLKDGKQLTPRDLPAIDQAAWLLRKGPYNDFTNAYTAIGRWLAAQGYAISGPNREIYTHPGALVEIVLPVTKS